MEARGNKEEAGVQTAIATVSLSGTLNEKLPYTPAEPGACVMACRMRGELGEECCCCSLHSGLSGTAVLANS